MSTRCIITFKDDQLNSHSIYRHSDGYPDGPHGVMASFEAAKPFAWMLPRFEADDFGAAYLAANKKGPGNYRLSNGPDEHADIAYHYIVTCRDGDLHIETIAL